MADVKYNKRHIFGDDDFKVTAGDLDFPGKHFGLQHDTSNVKELVGFGSKLVDHKDPVILADDGYFDLPAESAGHGFFFLGDGTGYAEIIWDTANTVTLISNTTNVDDADTDTYFCIFDNTSSVRVKNRLGSSVRVMFEYQYTETPMAPTFKAFSVPSGVDNLDASLTINSLTSTPKFRYKLGDADATDLAPWGYGETLSRVSVATPPTYNSGSPGLGSNDDAVKFNASDYYAYSGSGNQFTTGDIVVEAVFKGTNLTQVLFATRSTGVGLMLYTNTSGTGNCWFVIQDVDGQIPIASDASSIPDGQWVHVLVFINRDEVSTNGSMIYVNGVAAATGVDMSAAEKTLATSDFTVGARVGGGLPINSDIAYIAAWERANWHQAGSLGPREWAGIAKERFAKFCGYLPQVFTKTDVVKDGDMEAVGVADWPTSGTCTESKDNTIYYAGAQSLKLTKASTGYGRASQAIQVVGETYRVTGYARGDGTIAPMLNDGGGLNYWTGTSSTSWQEIDVTFTATSGNFQAGSYFPSAGSVWFDDLAVVAQKGLPTTNTRAFNAYLDKVEGDYRKLYYVGSEWLRMSHRIDSNAESVRGYLAETQNQNLFDYSEAFVTNWTLYDAGDGVNDNATVCPDGRTAAADWIPDNTDGRHELRKALTLTADTYSFSVFVKKGATTWVELVDTALGNVYGYYNLATNTLGTVGPSSDLYVEGPFYGDFYRLCLVFTGTAASHTLVIRVVDADADINYSTGNGVDVALSVWGAQVEQADYMTSPVITSGAAATRISDKLQYVANENIGGKDVGQGTITCNVLIPEYTDTTSKVACLFTDGGAATDRVLLYATVNGTSSPYAATTATAGNTGASAITASIADNTKHKLSMTWQTDYLVGYLDDVPDATPDIDCDMPDDLDEMDVGNYLNDLVQLNGLLSRLRIYSLPTTKG